MVNPAEYSLIGYLDNRKVVAIPNTTRQNLLALGEIGSGKSSILRLLIRQDILAKRGFLLAENHSELSREILSLIPPEEHHKIVYVNLGSIKRFQKTLRFNPLEIDDPQEAGIVALNFTECLAKAFSDSWGARVETCARNGALAVIGTQSNTLGAMLKLLTDDDWAESFTSQITNRQARDFFAKVYREQYPKEAGGTIFNKLNKMLTIPEMDAMFNVQRSSVSFADIINKGMYVVLDFGGVPNDMVKFLGNVFLHLFYTQYKKRERNSDGKYDTFNLYLDEVQMFSDSMIRELLNTVRKYGIKCSVATQSISALGKDLAGEIMTLCRAVACFRCDAQTAYHLKSILPISPEAQQQLSFHSFSFYSAGDRPVRAVAQTRHIRIKDRSSDAEAASVNRFGEIVSLEKYYHSQKGGNADVDLTPLQFGILNLLRMQNRDMTKGEITESMQRRYAPVKPRDISEALENTLISANGFVAKHDVQSDDGDKNFETRYSITSVATKNIFSKGAAGRRAGGDLHLSAIFMNMEVQTALGNYCIPDLGKDSNMKADLLIFSPKKIQDKSGNSVMYHATEWSETAVAVEVETAPGKHWNQVYQNWEKNTGLGHFVWFVVFNEKDKQGIDSMFSEKGISKAQYAVHVMNKEALLESAKNDDGNSGGRDGDNDRLRIMTEIEAAVLKILIDGGGGATQMHIIESAWNYERADVISALEHLQKTDGLQRKGSGKNDFSIKWSLRQQQDMSAQKEPEDVSAQKEPEDVSAQKEPEDVSAKPYPAQTAQTDHAPSVSERYHDAEKEDMDSGNDDEDETKEDYDEDEDTGDESEDNEDEDTGDESEDNEDDISDSMSSTSPADSTSDNSTPGKNTESFLASLPPEMLLSVWASNHDDPDPIFQRDVAEIESLLRKQGLMIKLRNGKFFLSKIPR